MLKWIYAGLLILSLGLRGYAWHQADAPMESGWYPGSFGVSQAWIAQGWDYDFEEREGKKGAGCLHFLAMQPWATPAKIQGLLARGFSLSARTREGATPLHYAARYNDNPAVLRTLIRLGADPNAKDRYGETPLFDVPWSLVDALLRQGARLNARSDLGATALHAALGDTKVKSLLRRGLSPNLRDRYGNTPLHLQSKEPVLRALLARGADPNLTDMNGRTPLHNHPEHARLLLYYGADPTARDRLGNTPLHYLVRRYLRLSACDRCERVEALALPLLEAGADPLARNWKGETPLDLAGVEARRCLSGMFAYFARRRLGR